MGSRLTNANAVGTNATTPDHPGSAVVLGDTAAKTGRLSAKPRLRKRRICRNEITATTTITTRDMVERMSTAGNMGFRLTSANAARTNVVSPLIDHHTTADVLGDIVKKIGQESVKPKLQT